MSYIPNPATDTFLHLGDEGTPAASAATARALKAKYPHFVGHIGATMFFRFPDSDQRNRFLLEYKRNMERQGYHLGLVRPELMSVRTEPVRRVRARL